MLLLFDSITTVGNIVMCFLGDFYMRALSSIILIFWFSSKGILFALITSTTMAIIVEIMETTGVGSVNSLAVDVNDE